MADLAKDLAGAVLDGRYKLISRRENRSNPRLEIYKAEHVGLSREVEVEILRVSAGDTGDEFKRSVELLARFDHPCIVPVFDSGVHQGCPYAVRPLAEGKTLAARLQKPPTWSLEQVATLLGDISDALEQVHVSGAAAHGFKPEDVLVEDSGRARLIELRAPPSGENRFDPRADLYALGVIARQIIPGEGPYLMDPARTRLLGLVDRLVAENLDERPTSADLVAHAFRAIARRADASESDTMIGAATLQPQSQFPVPITRPIDIPTPASAEKTTLDLKSPIHEPTTAPMEPVTAPVTAPVAAPAGPPPLPSKTPYITSIPAAVKSAASKPDSRTDFPPRRDSVTGTQSEINLGFVHSKTWIMVHRFVNRMRPIAEARFQQAKKYVLEQIWPDKKKRATAIAGAAALLMMIVAIIAVASSDDDDEGQVEVVKTLPSVELVKNARARTSQGDAKGAIAALERAIFQENRFGDPLLHAALAHAYVKDGRGADAIVHYETVLKKDPDVLDEEDVSELVGLLALPKEGDRAAELVVALGDRATPMLTELSTNESADKLMRTRAKKALKALPPPKKPRG